MPPMSHCNAKSKHANQERQRESINLLVQVPGQRRLAISRLQVPNLDGFVKTAAGDLFSIGTPRHRKDPEIVRSQDTNQQKQRGKHLGKKNLQKKNVRVWVPGHRRLANVTFSNSPFFNLFSSIQVSKKRLHFWVTGLAGTLTGTELFLSILI